jgi:dTDP-glucose 4,6-dehydratase
MKLNDGRVVPAFMDQALKGEPITIFGDGSQTRSFCFVSDLVDGLYRLMLSTEEYPVNLGNPHEMTIAEFANLIRDMTGSRAGVVYQDLPQDDPKQRRPDITKAQTLLGWNPVVGFEEGMGLTVQYFRGVHARNAGGARTMSQQQ